MFVIKPVDLSCLSSNQRTFHVCHQTNGPFTFVIKPVDLSCLSLNILAFCHVDIDVCIYSTCAFMIVKRILMLIMYRPRACKCLCGTALYKSYYYY